MRATVLDPGDESEAFAVQNGWVALYDIRPGNGVSHSYNPGARTGRNITL